MLSTIKILMKLKKAICIDIMKCHFRLVTSSKIITYSNSYNRNNRAKQPSNWEDFIRWIALLIINLLSRL